MPWIGRAGGPLHVWRTDGRVDHHLRVVVSRARTVLRKWIRAGGEDISAADVGVLLLFEGVALMQLVRKDALEREEFFVALLVALIANGLPYGYAVALVVGTAVHYFIIRASANLSR